jgi:hypothetical protein
VTVTRPGRHTLQARAQTTDNQRTEWQPIELVVREAATAAPSATPVPSGTPAGTPATALSGTPSGTRTP